MKGKAEDLTVEEIAASMKISVSALSTLANDTSHLFSPTKHIFVRHKHRKITPMKKQYKGIFRRLHRFLQSRKYFHPRALGGVKGKSHLDSARLHTGKTQVEVVDIHKCFPSISTQMLRSRLLSLGFAVETSDVLARLMSVDNNIPQGSPISTDAVNLMMWSIDQRISSLAGQMGISYSRIVDDCVLSGFDAKAVKRLAGHIEGQIKDLGLRVSERKRAKGSMHSSKKQTVHGLIVNENNRLFATQEHVAAAYMYAHKYLAICKSLQKSTIPAAITARRKVIGYLSYFCPTNSSRKGIQKLLKSGDLQAEKVLTRLRIPIKGKNWTTTFEKQLKMPRRLEQCSITTQDAP